jgi:GNAT superfamily N-acetyltransferase
VTREIRFAQPVDAAVLADLIRQHAAFEQSKSDISESDLASLLTTPTPPTTLIVAADDGHLIGYAALTFDFALWSNSRFAHLDCLFVLEAARGRGVGAQLFEAACRCASEAGVQRIEWQTPTWNVDAIGFYQRLGGEGRAKVRFSRDVSAASV